MEVRGWVGGMRAEGHEGRRAGIGLGVCGSGRVSRLAATRFQAPDRARLRACGRARGMHARTSSHTGTQK